MSNLPSNGSTNDFDDKQNSIDWIQVVILMVLQAVILLMYDVKVPVESKICQTLKKIEMPDLSHVVISISNKSKAKKEATLANSWNCLTVDSVVTDFQKLEFEVLTPAFEKAIFRNCLLENKNQERCSKMLCA